MFTSTSVIADLRQFDFFNSQVDVKSVELSTPSTDISFIWLSKKRNEVQSLSRAKKMGKKETFFLGIICFKNREQLDKAKREKMMDKFIFYSTLKVFLSPGINSI